jgi:hypothetical protein
LGAIFRGKRMLIFRRVGIFACRGRSTARARLRRTIAHQSGHRADRKVDANENSALSLVTGAIHSMIFLQQGS